MKVYKILINTVKINPISVRIIDPDLQTKLLFYSKKYKYRFIANSLLISSSIKEDKNYFHHIKWLK